MVLYDIFTVLVWLYLLLTFVWTNITKIIVGVILYIAARTGVLQSNLLELSELNLVTRKYYGLILDKSTEIKNNTNKFCSHEKMQKVWQFIKTYVVQVYTLLIEYLQMLFNFVEKKMRTDKRVDIVFEKVDKELCERKKKIIEIMKMLWKIDVEQLYDAIKRLQKMQRVQEIYDDDDIFNEEDQSVDINTTMPSNIAINDLLKSMPPELLEQSMKEAQNIDMSKMDIGKMMSDMNQMMNQINKMQHRKIKKVKKKNKK